MMQARHRLVPVFPEASGLLPSTTRNATQHRPRAIDRTELLADRCHTDGELGRRGTSFRHSADARGRTMPGACVIWLLARPDVGRA